MPFGLKRTDLQKIAQAKLDDAVLLYDNRRFSNAYYLAGYAVEIGLKACTARSILAEVIPDKSFIDSIYKHDLPKLVGTAGLLRQLQDRQKSDPNFAANWALVAQWGPEKRYEDTDGYTAQITLQAIGDPSSGVFPWIRTYW